MLPLLEFVEVALFKIAFCYLKDSTLDQLKLQVLTKRISSFF